MKFLRVLLFALIASVLSLTPMRAAKIYNRYGMVLVEGKDGRYTIKEAKAYEPLIGDPYQLPDALVPYEAEVPAYDKAAMEKVTLFGSRPKVCV